MAVRGSASLPRDGLPGGRCCEKVMCLPAEAFLSIMLQLCIDLGKAHWEEQSRLTEPLNQAFGEIIVYG